MSTLITTETVGDRVNGGSDPNAATCRGRLQLQRAKLNQEINKQMMIRNGAEKLYNATTNKKLKETVALELSFVNSSLQLLKAELTELNSSVHMYQSDSTHLLVPMIALGLKETKDIDFRDPFKDFILEHYSEDDSCYDGAIQQLMDIRKAVKTPTRDQNGIELLFHYYNLLYYVDRRFFSPHRSLGIFFEWFDSFTGLPSMQKTVAFEKACVLFNIGALYTQIGTKQNCSKNSGIDAAIDSFLRAGSIFHYIKAHFSNAPSTDLSQEMLEILTKLMLAQARERLLEKLLSEAEGKGLCEFLDVAQEISEMAEIYNLLLNLLSTSPAKPGIPESWSGLIQVKAVHYQALSHHYVAMVLLNSAGELSIIVKEKLEFLQIEPKNSIVTTDIRVPQNTKERHQLGVTHLHQAIMLHEEALRLLRICRQLQRVDNLQKKLQIDRDISLNYYTDIEEEDNFQEILDPPSIRASTKYQLTLTTPDFLQYKSEDLFKDLGPLKVFSAKHHWTAARTVHLKKSPDESFGLSVHSDAPVIVARVDKDSVAEEAGLREGDFIINIRGKDVKWAKHNEVVHLIKEGGNDLLIKVSSPMDYTKFPRSSNFSLCSKSTSSSSSGMSSTSSRNQSPVGSVSNKECENRVSWHMFWRKNSKEHSESDRSQNIVYR